MYKLLNSFLFVLLSLSMIGQQDPLVVTPAISPDGSQVSFSYQGDIWTLPTAGGIARRLTIHESYESNPQWSPDGTQIAFQGSRWGNSDIYVMNVDGGRPQRLTYHSTADSGPKWSADGNIIFQSRRGFAQVERESEVHMVPSQGGTPHRLVDATLLTPAISDDADLLAFERGSCRVAREAYTGPANRNIWLYSIGHKSYTQVTSHNSQDIMPDIVGDQLYFLSARDGRYNLYRTPINGASDETAEALTNFSDEGITHFDVSADGSTVVFTRGEGMFTFKTASPSAITAVNVAVSADDRFDPIEHEVLSSGASDYMVSSDEKFMVFEVRGELFVKQNEKDKKRAVQLTKNPYRDQDAVMVNDSVIVFSSDRDGNFDLFSIRPEQGSGNFYKSFKLATQKLTSHSAEEESLSISPDKTKIAYARGRGQLVVVDVDSLGNLSNEKLLLDGWDTPRGVAWSPDSKWLSYSLSDLNFNREIYIHAADGSQDPVNISFHPRTDRSPMWSKDGSKLGFVSNRNNSDDDIWFVWLKKSDWEKTQRDWEEDEDEGDKKKDEKSKKDKVATVVIDFEDIHERLEQVSRLAGNEGNLVISHDGETFYYSTNGGSRQGVGGKSAFMSSKWDGSEQKVLFSDLSVFNLTMDKKGKKIYGTTRRGIVRIDPSSKKQESLGFSAKMDIDHIGERQQVFEEGWRRLRDGFYDPEFHGQDWDQLKTQYRNRCVMASTEQDFRTYYNQMLGQLNASHMGMSGRNREETQSESTGLLGIDIEPLSDGIKVVGVIPGTPGSRTESLLEVGDVITSVNGNKVSASDNFYNHFTGTTSERTLLEVRSASGQTRDVVIRPTRSVRTDNYTAWVKERKRLTEEYSNGRLGYIHIQGMNWPSFERFERELAASGHNKEGIVIDVRFNGGGWTTDMLMTVLNVRQHSFTIPRGAAKSLEGEKDSFRETYPYGERLPLSSWTKPSVAMCNENSYSNAEIFSHAYQALGHGTLVGAPTFGAVISTGSAGLLNGSRVRMPFRAWYVKSTNKNMEHGPAIPDIEVYNNPDSKANGEDLQLQKSVEVLLSQIDQG